MVEDVTYRRRFRRQVLKVSFLPTTFEYSYKMPATTLVLSAPFDTSRWAEQLQTLKKFACVGRIIGILSSCNKGFKYGACKSQKVRSQ